MKTQDVPVAIGEGKHPAPFRTRKLSPLPPMVLLWRRSGRVGRRRGTLETGAGPKGRPLLLSPPGMDKEVLGLRRNLDSPPLGQIPGDAPGIQLVGGRAGEAFGQACVQLPDP